jgi:hypothetical protein
MKAVVRSSLVGFDIHLAQELQAADKQALLGKQALQADS